MSTPYQLAFTLQGHASDVKSLNAPSPNVPLLISGSRDGSAILWGPSRDGMWDVKLRVEGPERQFVNAVAMTRFEGQAYLLVGSQKGILSSYLLPTDLTSTPDANPEPTHMLVEHSENICCLDVSKGGLVASGSWDKTVRIWKDLKVVAKIEKHEMAVWAVKFVGEDRVLTDKKIYLHSIGAGGCTVLQEYTGHTQVVRGISLRADGKGFWSCGNDGLVNLYSFDKSEPVRSLSGHTSFIYSIAALPDGAVSAGEDGTLRVWSETELVQTIAHPSNSLWSAAVVPAANGTTYIASASQDSAIRFFTRDPTLVAPPTERERWDKDVSQRQLDKSQVGDVKHSDLPGMEALGREGKKDGQVIMIKNEGKVEAYSWSSAERTWQQVGQVVDAIGQGRKQLYEGKEYDYVFDVDVSEGMPPLKLPYNVSENPWISAQKFLDKYELPSSYTEQVVSFIEKNTSGETLGQGDAATYVDPYTGAARYTGASSSSAQTGRFVDPFTGGLATTHSTAYRSKLTQGGSAYSTQPAATVRSNKILPSKQYLAFKDIKVDAAKNKIKQLNEEIKVANPDLAFSADDEKMLFEVYSLASLPAVALAGANNKPINFDLDAYCSLVERWPEAQRFPLIDIARYLASVSTAFGNGRTVKSFLTASEWDKPWQAGKPRETNTLLALRGLANLFSTATGREAMAKNAGEILAKLKERSWAELGPRKLPFTTILLNYSALAANGSLPPAQAGALLDLLVMVLQKETADVETLYRASVAVGNLLISPSTSGGLQVDTVDSVRALVIERAGNLSEKRLKDVASEIGAL